MARLTRFHWVIYPFAGLLVVSAVRMLRGGEAGLAKACCETGPRSVSRIIPVVPRLHDGRFFAREGGRLVATRCSRRPGSSATAPEGMKRQASG